jgi:hypothetical protein
MPARKKLNQAYFLVSVFLAALIGWAGQSWLVFFVALAILLTGNIYSGQIRPARRGDRPRSKQ